MRQRFLVAVGMSLLLIAALMPAAASAEGQARFGRVNQKKHPISAQLLKELKQLRNPDRRVMVFVELSRLPVAASLETRVDAGQQVSEAERDRLREPLRQQQAGVRRQIEQLNGRVQASFTDVLNGFRVSVPAGNVADLANISGVREVHAVAKMERTNDNSARFLNAPKTWKNAGLTGNGVTIAVIDTGINYYHKTFNGTGEPDNSADNPAIVEPGTFPTAKVIGGWDFVGDAYDADTVTTATPDPDPNDCNGHGTHVAGTAAGMGVKSDGTTYTGPYNPNALNNTTWNVPPGMAPRAKLLAYKVFGCEGGTYVVLDAIERAVSEGADVINMSLGLDYGNGGRIEEVATNNAVRAGVVVVTSAGNSGPSAYINGSPGTAEGAISVAALDADPSFPSVWIDMPTGADIRGINANGDTDNFPVTGDLNHFEDDATTPTEDESLGCSVAAFTFNNFTAGEIAVTHRGVCARVDRAIIGDSLGASAVIMVNNSASFPPYEGTIAGVDIPFIGVPNTDEARFHTDDGLSATINEAPDMANPNYRWNATFTSGGFRRYDQLLKPDVIAPGVSVISADTNNVVGGIAISGTSMASPSVAGVAALVRQARPTLGAKQVKSLIVNTATTGNLNFDDLRIVGAGAVNAFSAATSKVHITVPNAFDGRTDSFQASLAFGYEEIINTSSDPALNSKRSFRIWNKSSRSVTYNLSNEWATDDMGLNVSISPSSVTVPAGSNKLVTVTITMTRAEGGALSDAAPGHGPVVGFDHYGQFMFPLEYIGGRIKLTPTATRAGIMALRVPWAVVPRGTSNVWPTPDSSYTTDGQFAEKRIRLRNSGIHEGIGDFFQWGLSDQQEGYSGMDMRAVGVQSLPGEFCYEGAPADERCIVFAINNWTRFSNPSENYWEVNLDLDGDETEDYEIFSLDGGLLIPGLDGVMLSVVWDVANETVTEFGVYFGVGGANGSTILLPFAASDIGMSDEGDTDFEYWAYSADFFDDDGDPGNPVVHEDWAFTGDHPDAGSMAAQYDVYNPAISNGHFQPVSPGGSEWVDVWVNMDTYDPDWGHKGWMIVSFDDPSGERQADLVPVGPVPQN
jgi:minor extracellular serine protease Vpr